MCGIDTGIDTTLDLLKNTNNNKSSQLSGSDNAPPRAKKAIFLQRKQPSEYEHTRKFLNMEEVCQFAGWAHGIQGRSVQVCVSVCVRVCVCVRERGCVSVCV